MKTRQEKVLPLSFLPTMTVYKHVLKGGKVGLTCDEDFTSILLYLKLFQWLP
jgi:hypothetical protein